VIFDTANISFKLENVIYEGILHHVVVSEDSTSSIQMGITNVIYSDS
jgi:hypothetical protein